jgi:AraC-like DNA-binding protein
MALGGRRSERLMLIGEERDFYAGLLGRPQQRISGGWHIYVPLEGLLTVTEGASVRRSEVAVLPAYTPHNISSDSALVLCVVMEPESVEAAELQAIAARLASAEGAAFANALRATYRRLIEAPGPHGFSTAEFDVAVFGKPLARRAVDRRIQRAVAALADINGAKLTAPECARAAGLSPSRFLHLFKDETGVSFRAFRAWKRARHMLHFVNEDVNLAHLAQQIGYPDSTHFSHSIRRFYGLKPRAIFQGSRDLAIYRLDGVAA